MDAVSQRSVEYLTEVEEAAEDVLTTKQQVAKYELNSHISSSGFCLRKRVAFTILCRSLD